MTKLQQIKFNLKIKIMRTTIVKNLITDKKEMYYNNLDLQENLISAIITLTGQPGNLLNEYLRQKTRLKTEKHSINNELKN